MTEKKIKIFGKEIHLTMRNEGDFSIANELFLDHQYRFCDQAIRNAKNNIVDIGGHLGFFSLYASLLNPNVPIYSFEPHEGNFELLKINLKNNRVRNVHPKQVAVSGEVGQGVLYLSQEDLNHSTVSAIEPTGETQAVQTITLERIFQKNRIEKCDLVKMDCEGAEFTILYQTPRAIFDAIASLFLEYHDGLSEKGDHHSGSPSTSHPECKPRDLGHTHLQNHLQEMGFKVECYPNSRMKNLGFLWCYK
ncbi:hypothetical protein COY07_06185 [Candidatus Peregrinibacteria bacterium CG_4_10_14_0_2_um_filter_43_11]|nr:MAG: hypothetical protein COY07_06185 [Candidatus Peregrinibacteria bacterium CG_4_10_14_0_2_um_filter_43_11]